MLSVKPVKKRVGYLEFESEVDVRPNEIRAIGQVCPRPFAPKRLVVLTFGGFELMELRNANRTQFRVEDYPIDCKRFAPLLPDPGYLFDVVESSSYVALYVRNTTDGHLPFRAKLSGWYRRDAGSS